MRHRADPAPARDHPATLADLRPGESACIVTVGAPPEIRERLRDLGFVEGERVRVVKTAPLADPIEYCVQGIHVGLRRREARWIEVGDARRGEGP
jgi:Fe2+ transport system protein FeoA